MWINELWLLGTAAIFTYVGWWFGRSDTKTIIAETIDSLIREGYLRTRLTDGDIEVLKLDEE